MIQDPEFLISFWQGNVTSLCKPGKGKSKGGFDGGTSPWPLPGGFPLAQTVQTIGCSIGLGVNQLRHFTTVIACAVM